MLRTGTYGPDLLDDQGGMPEYREQVTEVITPKFSTSFDKEAATAEQLVAQAGIAREAEVFSTGVSVIDSDSATALVAGAFKQSFPKAKDSAERVDQEPVPFRMQVTLVKSDGQVAGRRLPAGHGGGAVSAGPNLYDLLDVDRSASEAEIRAAWKAEIADLDPTDRRFRMYNQAAEVLLDPESGRRTTPSWRLRSRNRRGAGDRAGTRARGCRRSRGGSRTGGTPTRRRRAGWCRPGCWSASGC